jgi:hypothetical protein
VDVEYLPSRQHLIVLVKGSKTPDSGKLTRGLNECTILVGIIY